MPKFVKTERDEELWEKAKEIVKKQYGKTEADGDEFWKLVTGVYKQAGGYTGKRVKKGLYIDPQNLEETFMRRRTQRAQDLPLREGDGIQKSLEAVRDLMMGWKMGE